jgi:hypothetical protein
MNTKLKDSSKYKYSWVIVLYLFGEILYNDMVMKKVDKQIHLYNVIRGYTNDTI